MTPNSVFRKAILASVISSTLALTGCGGSDDDNSTPETTTPPPAPVANKAPAVSIAGEAQAKEQTEFKLTAEASDSDGSIASYAWTYQTDMELTVAGADTAELTVTSPDIKEDKAITFTLTVTDDDGATASIDKAVVVKRKVSSVSITGIVTDQPIVNANLTISAGSASVNAFADETGKYTATFSVDESEADALVQIRATGLGDQDNVEFVSQLSSMSKLVEQAGEDGQLNSEENFGVNITNVSTAEYALITREGQGFTTDVELQQALLNVDAEEKLKLAALIKIIVDNDDYELPEGVESTLDLVDDAATAAQFEAEVIERDPAIIEKTEEEIKDDGDLVSGATGSLVGDFILHNPKYVTSSAYHLSLAEEGKGTVAAVNQVAISSWTNTDGKVEINLEKPLIISQSQVQKRDDNNQPIFDAQNNPVMETWVSQTSKLNLKVLATNDVFRTVDFVTNAETFIDGTLDESRPPSDYVYSSNLLDKTKTLAVTKEDLVATWYLDIYERNNIDQGPQRVQKLTFNDDGSVSGVAEGETATWSVENNILTVNYADADYKGSSTFWITKSLAAGYQFVALDNGRINDDGSVDVNDAHAKSEWGWLFKQDSSLAMTEKEVIGRWTGFIGFEQDIYDMNVDEELNITFGLSRSPSSWAGRVEDGIFYREIYSENGTRVRFCDTANEGCNLDGRMTHEFVAVEDNKYFIRRVYEWAGEVQADILAIYEYSPETSYSEFTAGGLHYASNFFTYDAEGKLVEGSIKYEIDNTQQSSTLVSELSIGEQTYVFSLEDGKLVYNTANGRFVVELIEYSEQGLSVCTYPEGQSCTDENKTTWSFDMPHVGEFFINNPDYFTSSTYKINLEQTNWSKPASVKLSNSTGLFTFDWYLENGAIVLPMNTQEDSYSTNIDGQQVYVQIYLDSIKLNISENGEIQVQETRTINHDYNYVRTEVNEYTSRKMKRSDFIPVTEADIIGTWVVDGGELNNRGKGSYTFSEGGTGSANLDINNSIAEISDFEWEMLDGSLMVKHNNGIHTEKFNFTKDLRVKGYQSVVEHTEYDSDWFSASVMIKDEGTLPYEKADYVGRFIIRNGEDVIEESDFSIEIYDGLELRFGTSLSSIQGESVEEGIFTRSLYVNPLDGYKTLEPCDVQLDTCELYYSVTHKPIATDGERTYFARSWNNHSNSEVEFTTSSIYVLDKLPTMEIDALNDSMLSFSLINAANDENWRSRANLNGEETTYSLQIGDAEPLPYTFAEGKMTIRMTDGLIYNIELVPGSNTKDGVTLCQYLASESCESGEKVQLNFPNLYQ